MNNIKSGTATKREISVFKSHPRRIHRNLDKLKAPRGPCYKQKQETLKNIINDQTTRRSNRFKANNSFPDANDKWGRKDVKKKRKDSFTKLKLEHLEKEI